MALRGHQLGEAVLLQRMPKQSQSYAATSVRASQWALGPRSRSTTSCLASDKLLDQRSNF